MFEYIIISYVITAIACTHDVIAHDESVKRAFKVWIFSPLALPLVAFAKFINW